MINLLIKRARITFVSLFLIAFGVTTGCALRYVADYDAVVLEEIICISKKVDMFYGEVLETPADKRWYEDFKGRYIEIEVDFRALLMRNKIRAFNEETTKQINIALELWLDDKAKHKEKDTVADFTAKRRRKQFARVFTAMAKGEKAKDTRSGEAES